jgi:hypothetical protein
MHKLLLTIALLIGACGQNTPSPDEIVRRALNLVKLAPHYVVKGTAISDLDPNTVHWTARHQAPDRYHVTMGTTEVIVIGNRSWAYDSDKGWIPTGKPNPDPLKLTKLYAPEDVIGVKYGGKQNGTNYDWFVIDEGIDVTFYIDPTTGRLMSWDIAGDSGAIAFRYDYNTPVSISPPL